MTYIQNKCKHYTIQLFYTLNQTFWEKIVPILKVYIENILLLLNDI